MLLLSVFTWLALLVNNSQLECHLLMEDVVDCWQKTVAIIPLLDPYPFSMYLCSSSHNGGTNIPTSSILADLVTYCGHSDVIGITKTPRDFAQFCFLCKTMCISLGGLLEEERSMANCPLIPLLTASHVL